MTEQDARFATVEEAVEEIRQGRMIVLVDDEDRENEGDLTMAAEKVTPETINFMAKYGRGLVCLALTEERCDALHLTLMSPKNTSAFGTPFCESIDARRGTTTGISAADRATTILDCNGHQYAAGRFGAARAYFSFARAARRRAGARGADGSIRGFGAHRGARSGGRDLRDHE